MGYSKIWRHVDAFTVDEAAALWCELDPSSVNSESKSEAHSHAAAVKQMLLVAVQTRVLPRDELRTGKIRREDLQDFARSKNLSPSFLFDTGATAEPGTYFFDEFAGRIAFKDADKSAPGGGATPPAGDQSAKSEEMEADRKVASSSSDDSPASAPKPRGRPIKYDWEGMFHEVIWYADFHGLPRNRAPLVTHLLEWFSKTNQGEPAESMVREKLSNVYAALERKGWKPKD